MRKPQIAPDRRRALIVDRDVVEVLAVQVWSGHPLCSVSARFDYVFDNTNCVRYVRVAAWDLKYVPYVMVADRNLGRPGWGRRGTGEGRTDEGGNHDNTWAQSLEINIIIHTLERG